MVPTLEEYKATIEIDFESKIIEPPIGLKPTSVIAEFLNLKTPQVEKLIKSNTGNLPLSYLVANYSKLPKEIGNTSTRVFFGFVLFLTSRIGLNPLVAVIARQACLKWDFSNILLAKTVISLNKYQRHQQGVL